MPDSPIMCELCSDAEATVQVTQVIQGEVKKWNLCETCANQEGFDVQGPVSFDDILFGMGDGPSTPTSQEPKSCPDCHMQRSDFKKSNRLGCPSCYEVFTFELRPLIEAMHKGDKHVGKIPENQRLCAEMAKLQAELDKAVSDQNFEEAARLRDLIKEKSNEANTEASNS